MTGQNRKFSLVAPPPEEPHKPGNKSKYDPEYCMTIRLMAQEGKFPEEWCAEIGVTMSTMYRWANTYPDFSDAFHIAWHILAAVWTKRARAAVNKPGAHRVLLHILERRFPDIYGHNARVTHEHFSARDKPVEEQPPTPSQAMDAEMRKQRIEELIAKKMAEKEKSG